MTSATWFDGWDDVARVVAIGAIGYVFMVLALRLGGKRTLSKLNAFDLVVTVALGSVLATIALSQDVSLTEGSVAIGLLVLAQWVVSWLSVHSSPVARLVRSEATVVFRDGQFDADALRTTRLLRREVDHAIRASGYGDYEMVAVVVLETDGSLSVVPADQCSTGSALPDAAPRRASPAEHPATIDPNGQLP